MIAYIYDGTFEGILTCIYESYYTNEEICTICTYSHCNESLLYKIIEVKTDIIKSNKVVAAIKNKLGYERLINIYYAYLSEEVDAPYIIYKYIKYAFKVGNTVDMRADVAVLNLLKIRQRVSLEAHRFLGFVRFQCLANGVLYSSIEPDCNILTIISSHFKNRYIDEAFIIHDTKRDFACLKNNNNLTYITLSKNYKEYFAKNNTNKFYEDLWISYYKSTTIKERKNLKLMKSYMPKRYFKNLTECLKL